MPTFICKPTLNILLKCSQIVPCPCSLKRTNSCVKKKKKKQLAEQRKTAGQAIIHPRNRPDRCQRQLCDWSFTATVSQAGFTFPPLSGASRTQGLKLQHCRLQISPPFSTHARRRGGKNNRLYSRWPGSLSLPGSARLGLTDGRTDGHLQLIKTQGRKVGPGD